MKMKSRLGNIVKTSDSHFAEVVKHAFWGIVILVCGTAIQFLFDVFLARSFGTHGTGVFYLCMSVLLVLGILGRLGLDRAVVRFIPEFNSNKKPENILGLSRTAAQLSLSLTIPLGVLLFVFSPFLANEVYKIPELTQYLQTFAFAVPAFSLLYVYSGILRGIKLTRAALTIERIMVYALGIISIFTLGLLLKVEGVIIGFTLASYITAIAAWFLVRRSVRTDREIVPFNKGRLMVIAGPLLFVAFATQLNGQASVLILGAFADASDVGIFNIALKISLLMTLILTAINVIAATKISELYGAKKKRELAMLISKIAALGTVGALPLTALLVLFPHFFLSLFGQDFTSGALVLVILALGQFINVSVGTTVYVLAMTGHERALALAVGISLVFNILAGFILIPMYGIVGAGIATALTIAISNVIMLLQIRYYLGIWQLPFRAIGVWIKAGRNSV